MKMLKFVDRAAAESAPLFKNAPSFHDADCFLSDLDPAGIFTFQAADDDGVRNYSSLNRVLHGTFAQHKYELAWLNACGAGIWFMLNRRDGIVRPENRNCLSHKNVLAVRATFISLGDSTIDNIHDSYGFPDRMVESSVGRYDLYWFRRGLPLREFERVQKCFAKRTNAYPPVLLLSGVMRLQGFINHRDGGFRTTCLFPG